jgi:PiT family inorganic phosphate transporter
MDVSLVIVLLLVLAAEFTNGLTDAPNAIATVVSTRVLSPYRAVAMAAVLNILGVLVTGTAVAVTIGKDIVKPEVIGLHTVGAAVIAVVVWSTITWRFGLPTSETHELVAGLAGAGLASAGPSVLLWEGWEKVLIGLGLSTVLGFSAGFIVMVAIYWLFRRARRAFINALFSRLQILSAAVMSFSHGSNDGQKFMGFSAWPFFSVGCYRSFRCPCGLFSFAG